MWYMHLKVEEKLQILGFFNNLNSPATYGMLKIELAYLLTFATYIVVILWAIQN